MKDSKTLLELIRHSPKFTISFLAFITAIVSFIILYRENPQLIIVVLVAVLLIASWLIFFYIAIAKSPPLIVGGKGVLLFPRLRPVAILVTILLPLITIILGAQKSNQQYVRDAIYGVAYTPTIFATQVNQALGSGHPQASATPSNTPISFLGHKSYCVGYNVIPLPTSMVPSENSNLTIRELISYYYSTDDNNNFYPDLTGEFSYTITIQNTSGGNLWARLDNSVLVSIIKYEKASNDNVNIFNPFLGCGGEVSRVFPSVQLATSQDLLVSNEDADSFSLQPGEYEDFSFKLQCKLPGEYQILFEISVIDQGRQIKKKIDGGRFICPSIYTEWVYDDFVEGFRKYTQRWGDNEYILEVPFQKGDKYVVTENGELLNLRKDPSASGEILEKLKAGRILYIEDGPIQADGYTWWYVFTWNGDEIYGWVAENPDWYVLYQLYYETATPSP